MSKKLFFLSDVHLSPERPDRLEALRAFLRARREEAEAFYIIGDLVDYWVGARQLRLAPWAAVFERLAEAASGGPPVLVLGGNRDYLFDSASLAPYGFESLGMEHHFKRDGLCFALLHGHMQFPDPWYASGFLWFIQRRPIRWVAQTVPLWACLGVARFLRWWRRLVVGGKNPKYARRYDPAAFARFFDAGANVVVCGHNHWARDYTPQLARPGCRLFALGPWNPGPSWLEYADGAFKLVDPNL